MNLITFAYIYALLSVFAIGGCDELYAKIYYDIMKDNQIYQCIRRLNNTHQIGCNSKETGNVGVIHVVNTDSDVEWIVSKGQTDPYIAVLTTKHLTMQTLNAFRKSGRVNGVILIDNLNSLPNQSFSPDSRCPNEMLGLYANSDQFSHCSKQAWNRDNPSLGLMFEEWPFPIMLLISSSEADVIINCFNRRNNPNRGLKTDVPLCSAEMTSTAFGAKDSSTCLRRPQFWQHLQDFFSPHCSEIEGHNIFSPLIPTSNNNTIENRSVVILASRIDSFSLFNDLSPGADSVFTGLLTMLSIADTLAKYRQDIVKVQINMKVKKNVLFCLFDGESFGYIGSSSSVYEMLSEDEFPVRKTDSYNQAQLRLNHFSHFIELNQLAPHQSTNLWIHTDVNTHSNSNNFSLLIEEIAGRFNVSIKPISSKLPLPPASLQTFLKHDPNIIGVVITNHEKEFTNQYYHSIFDNYYNLGDRSNLVQHLTQVNQIISTLIYKLLTNEDKNDVQVDNTLIEQLIDCYLVNNSCALFNQLLNKPNMDKNSDESNRNVFFTTGNYHDISYRVLANILGEKTTTVKDNCNSEFYNDESYKYVWISGGESDGTCIKSQVVKSSAQSPAFITGDHKSKEYSTWTESHHEIAKIRIFYAPNLMDEIVTLLIGVVILINSILIVYWLKNNSDTLFNISRSTSTEEAIRASKENIN